MKTYAGGQGYVYQYYFVGKRAAPSDPTATEYIFDVTPDRKTTFAVTVILPAKTLEQWSRNHSRALTDAEQYAAAKMRLLQAFDEITRHRVAAIEPGAGRLLDGIGAHGADAVGPGTHLIDMYPLLYTQQPSYANTPYGMIPVLTYEQDEPGLALGYQLPAIRLAITIVK